MATYYYMYFPFLACEVKCGTAPLDTQILAFSISHDYCPVRIYGYYPVIIAYRFKKNVYDIWMRDHFKKICSAVNQLPSNLDFDVLSLSEATGLS
ncbi:hypothetical protein GE09DRAFT_1244238 [Coniochaeta sp. 2T2.1]|nr:hypothetical protein GE09DRAFT_1244238 [Coniochaeta sp. 2T2.1]